MESKRSRGKNSSWLGVKIILLCSSETLLKEGCTEIFTWIGKWQKKSLWIIHILMDPPPIQGQQRSVQEWNVSVNKRVYSSTNSCPCTLVITHGAWRATHELQKLTSQRTNGGILDCRSNGIL